MTRCIECSSRALTAAGIVMAAALSLAPPTSAGDLPPAERVLARYAEAIGGDAVAKVENRVAEFEFSMPSQGVYATGAVLRWSTQQTGQTLEMVSSSPRFVEGVR